MRVKVMIRPVEEYSLPTGNPTSKASIEYFNDVDSWFVEGGVLHLERNLKKIASIYYWLWIKEDV